MSSRHVQSIALCALLALPSACNKQEKQEPPAKDETAATQATAPKPSATAAKPKPKPKPAEQKPRKITAKPVATVAVADGDPHKGQFTLEDATKGLPKGNKLVATIDTELGSLQCDLYDDKAPITVATFVGLARGMRAWKDKGKWVKKPLYDGTVFHRVIKGFMVQGGDPAGNGSGGPGFVIPDEIWEDAHHDQRGLLCMANRGPNTNGSQFFILDGKAPHLDGGYTIFGKCSPEDVITKLSAVEVKGDRASAPPKIRKLTIKRVVDKDKAEAPASSASGAPTAAPPAAESPAKTEGPAKSDPIKPVPAKPTAPAVPAPAKPAPTPAAGETPATKPQEPALPTPVKPTPAAPTPAAPTPAPKATP
jgi:peptidyl-prolyl cis-trans isomerase A (cyclophilin A)